MRKGVVERVSQELKRNSWRDAKDSLYLYGVNIQLYTADNNNCQIQQISTRGNHEDRLPNTYVILTGAVRESCPTAVILA